MILHRFREILSQCKGLGKTLLRWTPSRKVWVPILLFLIGIIGYQFLLDTEVMPQPSIVVEQRWTVAARLVRPGTVRPRLHVFGRVTATLPIEMRAGVSGFITLRDANLIRGSIVEKDQLLIALDDRDIRLGLTQANNQFNEANALLDEIQASLQQTQRMLEVDRLLVTLAEKRLTRRRNLSARGVTSDEALDSAMIETEIARRTVAQREGDTAILQARIVQQHAVIARARTSVAQAQRDLDHTRITAPETAFVESVSINVGSRVNVNQTIAVLLPLTSFEAMFRLSAAAYARLTNESRPLIGRPVDIAWSQQPGHLFNGVITRIDARVDDVDSGIIVYATLDDLDRQTPLRPGFFLNLSLDDATFEEVIRLPRSAIMPDGNLYVIGDDDRLTALEPTEIVLRVEEDVLVRVHGIGMGACIVTTRFSQIGNGVKVDPQGCDTDDVS